MQTDMMRWSYCYAHDAGVGARDLQKPGVSNLNGLLGPHSFSPWSEGQLCPSKGPSELLKLLGKQGTPWEQGGAVVSSILSQERRERVEAEGLEEEISSLEGQQSREEETQDLGAGGRGHWTL